MAKVDRISKILGWNPRYDDLDTIVNHALAWEQRLIERGLPFLQSHSQKP